MAQEDVRGFRLNRDADGNLVGQRVFIVDEIRNRVVWGTDGMPDVAAAIDPDEPTCVADSFVTSGIGLSPDKTRVTISYSSNRRFVYPDPAPTGGGGIPPGGERANVTSRDIVLVNTVNIIGGFLMKPLPSFDQTAEVSAPVFLVNGDPESPQPVAMVDEPRLLVEERCFLTEPITLAQQAFIASRINKLDDIAGLEYRYLGISQPTREDALEITHRWELDFGTPTPENPVGGDIDINAGGVGGPVLRPSYVFPPLVDGDPARDTEVRRLPYHDLGYSPKREAIFLPILPNEFPVVGSVYNRPIYSANTDPQGWQNLPGSPFPLD